MEPVEVRVTVRLKDRAVLEAYDRLAKETRETRNHLLALAIEIAFPYVRKRAKAMVKPLQ